MEIFGAYNLHTILTIVFAIFYYKAADIEKASKLLWTGLSIVVSLGTRILGWGLLGLILGQIALLFIIGIVRWLLSRKD